MIPPLLKWAGSKRWHVAAVQALYDGNRVVEPFCGSCAITFGLEPKRALLNDANPHLINFYRWLQKGFDLELPLESSESLYYDYRTWFNRLIREARCTTADAAQLFYYLNQHGFNGLCRFNSSGEFNVPFRPGRTAPVFDVALYKRAFLEYEFTNEDFRDVLLEAEDFVYADPPYDGTFTDYTSKGWNRDDNEELAVLLRSHPGKVVLMNSATDWILKLYRSLGYHVTLLESQQKMHRAQGRDDVVPEVMATNFAVDPRVTI